jgi:Ni,Fe-hydrogenase III component G
MISEKEHEEKEHIFNCFCSFVSILHNKKMNYASILLSYIQNKKLRDFFKMIHNIDNDMSAIRVFLEHDPTLHKSKYVMKFINNKKNKKTIESLR